MKHVSSLLFVDAGSGAGNASQPTKSGRVVDAGAAVWSGLSAFYRR